MAPQKQTNNVQSSIAPEAPLPEPAHLKVKQENGQNPSRWQSFKYWYRSKKKIAIPLTVLILLIILALVPWTRYKAAGLFIKTDYVLRLEDSSAHTPVSGATVRLGSITSKTDGNGVALLRSVPVGNHKVQITKSYYKKENVNILVPFFGQKTPPLVAFDATGRQVKIIVTDYVSDKPLANVNIKLAGIESKTGADGTALVVLPADSLAQQATFSLGGYFANNSAVKSSSTKIQENKIKMVLSQRILFIASSAGKINLMSARIDGSHQQVVLAGTGNEQADKMQVSTSPDSLYTVLISKRSAKDSRAQLYILSGTDDEPLNLDSGSAAFHIVGWSGDNLIYTATRDDLQPWQAGRSKLKSYNANTGKTIVLDQTSSSDPMEQMSENYAFTMYSGDSVVYAKSWSGSNSTALATKQSSLHSTNVNGQNHNQVSSYDPKFKVQYVRHNTNSVYVWAQSPNSSEDEFYDYTIGSGSKKIPSLSPDQFTQAYPDYLFSPSGKQTFWLDSKNGQNNLVAGDSGGLNAQIVDKNTTLNPYSWFTDNFLLMTKNGNQLYIMGAKGGTPVKVIDFLPTSNS